MARVLTLQRRRANLVDLTLPVQAGVSSYIFSVSSNFDASPSAFDTVPAGTGKVTPSARSSVINAESYRGLTRFAFAPSDYTSPAAMNDSLPMWFSVQSVPVVGAGVSSSPGAASAKHLVLPYSSQPDRPVVISGSAPSATNISGSLELQLPLQCRNLMIQTVGSATAGLWVAFEPFGPEMFVPLSSTFGTYTELTSPNFSQLFVRGDGAAVTFNAVMALRNNHLG